MFEPKENKKNVLSKKDFLKKTDYFLSKHFFSIEDFLALSKRAMKKAVKYISQINGIKLRRNEIDAVIEDFKSLTSKKIAKRINQNSIISKFVGIHKFVFKGIKKSKEILTSFFESLLILVYRLRMNRILRV